MEFQFSALVLFALVAAITPGPNNIMLMASGLNYGVRSSVPHLLGVCVGFPAMFIAIGLGMGYVFEVYPQVHEVIKVLGIAYLLYLAWGIANAAPSELDDKQGKPLTFFQAALFQWVNPKAWIMGTSAIATFTTGGADIYQQIVMIAAVFFAFTFPSCSAWLVLGRYLRKLINRPKQQRVFNWLMATLLIGSIAPIAWDLLLKYTI